MSTANALMAPLPHRRRSSSLLFTLLTLAGVALLCAGWAVSTYNGLIQGDQQVRSHWAQVETAYQRRTELVPNIVEAVRGAAGFDTKALGDVSRARAEVTQLSQTELQRAAAEPQALERFQATQQALAHSLQRLLAVSEAYPDLKASANFGNLQTQLEEAQNRIAVETHRFNEAARDFNTLRSRFPALLVAGAFGSRFAPKPYFAATPVTPKQFPVHL